MRFPDDPLVVVILVGVSCDLEKRREVGERQRNSFFLKTNEQTDRNNKQTDKRETGKITRQN